MLNIQGKIVVLYGGPSKESAVSKSSAESVFAALKEIHEDIQMLEYTDKWMDDLKFIKPAFVFNAMHGKPGEDGGVQAVLDELSLPYQGSGMIACVKAMDKQLTKQVLENVNIETPKGVAYPMGHMPEDLPFYPAFVKPNSEGSSVGASLIHNKQEWQAFLKEDLFEQDDLLVEEYIKGQELTVGVLGDASLGVMLMRPKHTEFFDYKAKYTKGETEYIYPAPIATEVYGKAEEWAVKAHKSLGCSGVSRVDFLLEEEKNRLVILEVNTLPGMTSTSLVPKMAAGKGMSYTDVLVWMIEDGINKF